MTDWRSLAACRDTDPELFFPLQAGGATPEAALLCRTCPVVSHCLQEALRLRDTHGYRGGMSGEERLQILRGQPKPDVATQIRRLRARGWTVPAVCLRLGVADHVVHRAMAKGAVA